MPDRHHARLARLRQEDRRDYLQPNILKIIPERCQVFVGPGKGEVVHRFWPSISKQYIERPYSFGKKNVTSVLSSSEKQ